MDHYQNAALPKIAYLLNSFPWLSETFIQQEIVELEQQGLPLRLFSLLVPPPSELAATNGERQIPVSYLPNPRHFPSGILTLLRSTARRLLKAPRRFVRASLVMVVQSHSLAALKHLPYAAYLAEQMEAEGITHLHAHFSNRPASVAQCVFLLTGTPYSFTAHAYDIYLSSNKAELAAKMRMARFVVTCTGYNQKYLASLIEPPVQTRLHCIYHGVNLRAFPATTSGTAARSQQDSPCILAIARLIEKKGLTYLVRACRLLADQGCDFHCRIVGEGPLRPALEQEIAELGLSERVELWGAERHERVLQMYEQATLTVLPCIVGQDGDRDGIPNVLVESLAMGVPVISTTVSAIPELIRSGDNGLLVAPHDIPALAAALARLLNDPALRSRLAEAGRQTVLTHFDLARNVIRLKDLLCTTIEVYI